MAAGIAILALAYPAWLGMVELPKARRVVSSMATEQLTLQATVQDLRDRMSAEESRLAAVLDWSGPASPVVLSPPPRGQSGSRVLNLAAGQPHAPLMVVPPDLSGMSPQTPLEFSVTDPNDLTIWGRSLSVQDVRRHVADFGAVVFLLPSNALPDGTYRLLVRSGSMEEPELMTVPFQVIRRD